MKQQLATYQDWVFPMYHLSFPDEYSKCRSSRIPGRLWGTALWSLYHMQSSLWKKFQVVPMPRGKVSRHVMSESSQKYVFPIDFCVTGWWSTWVMAKCCRCLRKSSTTWNFSTNSVGPTWGWSPIPHNLYVNSVAHFYGHISCDVVPCGRHILVIKHPWAV